MGGGAASETVVSLPFAMSSRQATTDATSSEQESGHAANVRGLRSKFALPSVCGAKQQVHSRLARRWTVRTRTPGQDVPDGRGEHAALRVGGVCCETGRCARNLGVPDHAIERAGLSGPPFGSALDRHFRGFLGALRPPVSAVTGGVRRCAFARSFIDEGIACEYNA